MKEGKDDKEGRTDLSSLECLPKVTLKSSCPNPPLFLLLPWPSPSSDAGEGPCWPSDWRKVLDGSSGEGGGESSIEARVERVRIQAVGLPFLLLLAIHPCIVLSVTQARRGGKAGM